MTFEERPHGCQDLVPKLGGLGSCAPGMEKIEFVRAWLPYQDVIKALVVQIDLEAFENAEEDEVYSPFSFFRPGGF